MKKKTQAQENDANSKKVGERMAGPVTLDIKGRGKKVRLEFASETDRDNWQRASQKRPWYIFYFFLGIGINFLMYFAGLDLSRNIFLGALVGMGVPLSSMFLFTVVHFYLLDRKKLRDQKE
ncbi:MAG TPA: hypothetical protein VLH18_05295 [Candidatus Limnocylindrales bacterium]|nr:hypothetical protein [Candidatus Limnocylindrales bacterium]